MKIKIWTVATTIPEAGATEPCEPASFGTEEEAEAWAEKQLQEEWNCRGLCDNEGNPLDYPGDWRAANDTIHDRDDEGNWGEWRLTSHEIEVPDHPAIAFTQQIARLTLPADEIAAESGMPVDVVTEEQIDEFISDVDDDRLMDEYHALRQLIEQAREICPDQGANATYGDPSTPLPSLV